MCALCVYVCFKAASTQSSCKYHPFNKILPITALNAREFLPSAEQQTQRLTQLLYCLDRNVQSLSLSFLYLLAGGKKYYKEIRYCWNTSYLMLLTSNLQSHREKLQGQGEWKARWKEKLVAMGTLLCRGKRDEAVLSPMFSNSLAPPVPPQYKGEQISPA